MQGRDYNLIYLEEDNKYDKMLVSIMEKRSNLSAHDIKLSLSLEQVSQLTDSQYQTVIDYCKKDISTRQDLYGDFLSYIEDSFESTQEQAEQIFAVMLFAQREYKKGYPLFAHVREE